MKRMFLIAAAMLMAGGSFAQTRTWTLDATHPATRAIQPLPMRGTDPAGTTLSVNNQYFEKNGKPWFPLMGELHYNRVRPEAWADEIQKMKDGGLAIVATYVFWNEHERTQGVWDWTKNRDLRRFIQICAQKGMYVWLRIGPWSHGEQLHGGFPEWIQQMKGYRRNTPLYLAASKILYEEIGKQAKGLFFKDGGPIIGTQLENEYASGDLTHISELKKMALEAGIAPVYWSVTANTVFDDSKTEVIPLQGSYPYRGWESGGGKATKDFLYANDQWIMSEAFGKLYYDVDKYPKGLCEQGCGSQQTLRNRFVVEPHVVEAHLQNQIGRGMNLVGYYMFHGGTQTPGLEEPGYPMSYDFQSPLTEFGLIRPSYKYLKVIHHFINDFGTDLAAMQVVKPADMVTDEQNTSALRYVARVNGNSGFLFICNTQVRVPMPDKTVSVEVKLPGETVTFPEMTIKGQTAPILPFNLKTNGINIKYATVQPLAKIQNNGRTTLFFFQLPGVTPEFSLEETGISSINANGWKKEKTGGITRFVAAAGTSIDITGKTGQRVTLVVLTREEAEQSWLMRIKGKEALLLSKADVMQNNDQLELRQLNDARFNFRVFPAGSGVVKGLQPSGSGLFDGYIISVKADQPDVSIKTDGAGATIRVPASLSKSLSNCVLAVDYQGGACEMRIGGTLAADDLYNDAGPWMIGLDKFTGQQAVLQAQPWKDNITGVPAAAAARVKAEGPRILSVKAVPQYRALVQ